jgi:hypothetical protein
MRIVWALTLAIGMSGAVYAQADPPEADIIAAKQVCNQRDVTSSPSRTPRLAVTPDEKEWEQRCRRVNELWSRLNAARITKEAKDNEQRDRDVVDKLK